MLPLKFPRTWLALGWLFVGLALLVCLAPPSEPALKPFFVLNDKVEHALGYVALSIWFAGLYPRSRYVWIAVGLFAMGVVVELFQGWMSFGRQRDVRDVVANSAGIALGLLLARVALGGWAQRIEDILSRRER